MLFERGHISQAYFFSCCFVPWSRVLHTSQADFVLTLYMSQSLISLSSCVYSIGITGVYHHGWHGTHLHAILEGAADVYTCAWECRGQKSMLCIFFSHPPPDTMSQSFFLNLQITVLDRLIGQPEPGIHLSPPLNHWVIGM